MLGLVVTRLVLTQWIHCRTVHHVSLQVELGTVTRASQNPVHRCRGDRAALVGAMQRERGQLSLGPRHQDWSAVWTGYGCDDTRAVGRQAGDIHHRGGGDGGRWCDPGMTAAGNQRRPEYAFGNLLKKFPAVRRRQRLTLTDAIRWGYFPTLIRLISLRVAISMIDSSSDARLLT